MRRPVAGMRLVSKIATSLEWPKEFWILLIQSVLIRKAREIHSVLLVEKNAQYEEVKQAILKAYELVPEEYHQKFRNNKKQDFRPMSNLPEKRGAV